MAGCTCAFAQSSTSSSSFESAIESLTSHLRNAKSLAFQATDEVDNLRDVHSAYVHTTRAIAASHAGRLSIARTRRTLFDLSLSSVQRSACLLAS